MLIKAIGLPTSPRGASGPTHRTRQTQCRRSPPPATIRTRPFLSRPASPRESKHFLWIWRTAPPGLKALAILDLPRQWGAAVAPHPGADLVAARQESSRSGTKSPRTRTVDSNLAE